MPNDVVPDEYPKPQHPDGSDATGYTQDSGRSVDMAVVKSLANPVRGPAAVVGAAAAGLGYAAYRHYKDK